MHIINVGFNSKKWNSLIEGMVDYKILSDKFDQGDAKIAKHIVNAIEDILQNDYNTAYREANLVMKIANGEESQESDNVKCPFCQGRGFIEFEYQNDHRDPADLVEARAPCIACDGVGEMNAYDCLSLYANNSNPVDMIIHILQGNMICGRSIANDIAKEIQSHCNEIFQKSVDKLR